MENKKILTGLPLAVLVPLAVHAQVPPDVAARANAELQQQVEQRRDAQQRAATVAAPVVRSTAPAAGEYPVLPVETPCFRIDTFSVEVPDIVSYANKNGLTVVDIGATRPVCASCQATIAPTGANISTPLKNPTK